jgi:hypothetical protein
MVLGPGRRQNTPGNRYHPEQMIAKLRQADEALDERMNVPEIKMTLADDLTPRSVRAQSKESAAARRRASCAAVSRGEPTECRLDMAGITRASAGKARAFPLEGDPPPSLWDDRLGSLSAADKGLESGQSDT